MVQEWISEFDRTPKGDANAKTPAGKTALKKTILTNELFLERIVEICEELDEGLGSSAEETILHVFESHELDDDQSAIMAVQISRSLEFRGKLDEAKQTLESFSKAKKIEELSAETRVELFLQIANLNVELDEAEEAVRLVEEAFEIIREVETLQSNGNPLLVRARAYRSAGDIDAAIRDAEKALSKFREVADWRGMAWSYHELGLSAFAQANYKRAHNYFNLALQIVGKNTAPVILARLFSDLGATEWFLNAPRTAVEHLVSSLEYYNLIENRFRLMFTLNDLGVSLLQLGDIARSESTINEALSIAEEFNHSHKAGILDSLAEIYILRNDLETAESYLVKASDAAKQFGNEQFDVLIARNFARTALANGKFDYAIELANKAQTKAEKLGVNAYVAYLQLISAEAYLRKEDKGKAREILDEVEEEIDINDFYLLGTLQRLQGEIELANEKYVDARYLLRRALTVFETREDIYNQAIVLDLLGDSYAQTELKEASKNYILASEAFRKMGVKKFYNRIEYKIRELESPKRKKAAKEKRSEEPTESVRTQMLMQRLAEATASRELLFRELISILTQESKASKFIIAQTDEDLGWTPLITNDYTTVESNALVKKLSNAIANGNINRFEKENNAAVFLLKPRNAPAAALCVAPKYSAVLHNGGKFEPLLKIVELGLDVCALRDMDRDETIEEELNPFVTESIMPGFIHSSPAMMRLVEEVYRIRSSDVTVLVTGESGTGKELVSRAIHSVSSRKDKVFVPFNCTAVPRELTEGHLFGYKRGAFTGAANDSPGMIKTADGGTLLLDEIGDLPIDVQPKLLRFLQEGEIQPLGERKPLKVDVRVIAATNMNLEERVKMGLFREDLYYRINVVRLRVPPLRDRKSEIKPMVMYYINRYSQRFNKKNISIKPQTIDLLMVSDWEGNVRQLCNEIQRIIARAEDGEIITPEHISPELRVKPVQTTVDESGNVVPLMANVSNSGAFTVGMEGATIEEAVCELERQMILDSMRRNDGNITRVSKELGLTRRGLYLKIDRYGIKRAS
ncbi:MAG: sigma 54-interacting transcriptional regulator [Pyrinomonadaceae bacterium]